MEYQMDRNPCNHKNIKTKTQLYSHFGPKSNPISPIATTFGCLRHRSISSIHVSLHDELQCG